MNYRKKIDFNPLLKMSGFLDNYLIIDNYFVAIMNITVLHYNTPSDTSFERSRGTEDIFEVFVLNGRVLGPRQWRGLIRASPMYKVTRIRSR
jgi:hypothetical protein